MRWARACESAAARRVARQFGLSTSTVLAMDLRYLERWSHSRKKPALRDMGVDEIHLGKKQKFITVVSNLDVTKPVWFGQDRKKDTLDEFFEKRLSPFQRGAVQAACVDMWDPFRQSIEQWLPKCRIIYDKFHIMQHANAAVDEVRRAEFFRKGGAARAVVKGERSAAVALGESDDAKEAATQRSVCAEPARDEGVPAQGELGPAMELQI